MVSDNAATIVYMHNPSRAHKLLPLLEEWNVLSVSTLWGLLTVKGQVANASNVLVMIDNFGLRGLIGVALAALLKLPLAVRLRGEVFREVGERFGANRNIKGWASYLKTVIVARMAIKNARLLIFNSKYLRDRMAPYIARQKSVIVYSPFTELARPGGRDPKLQLPDGDVKLLTVTNFNLESKVMPTIEAILESLSDPVWEEYNVKWVIAGDGYHRQRLINVVRRWGLEERVIVPGRVGAVRQLYEWCDVLVHLTRMDAFPNVTMEAMMLGKPVITNADSCGTLEQVIQGENGFVVSNEKELIEAIKAYASSPALRNAHGDHGKVYTSEMFSVEQQRMRMNAVLMEFFKTAKAGAGERV